MGFLGEYGVWGRQLSANGCLLIRPGSNSGSIEAKIGESPHSDWIAWVIREGPRQPATKPPDALEIAAQQFFERSPVFRDSNW